jgi:hypothetical protein
MPLPLPLLLLLLLRVFLIITKIIFFFSLIKHYLLHIHRHMHKANQSECTESVWQTAHGGARAITATPAGVQCSH